MNKEIINDIVRKHFVPIDHPYIEGSQMWDSQWWMPLTGCDTLQNLVEDLYAAAAEKSDVESVGFAEQLFLSSNVDPNPDCSCRACNPKAWWMVVCSKCGNKRCPHATHHDQPCTNSNAPGQPGSEF